MSNAPWFIAIVVSIIATVCSGTVLAYLKKINDSVQSMAQRQKEQDERISDLARDFESRKATCLNEFVQVGTYLREAGHNRLQLEDLLTAVNTLTGKFDIVQQMPNICGRIAAETVKEMAQVMQKERG